MNIKIADSWLREHLKTKASPKQIAECLSLSSVSVEKLEKYENELVYDIEVTSNRVDLMSVIGIAREAKAALEETGIQAEFIHLKTNFPQITGVPFPIEITIDPKIVNRICAVVMDVSVGDSPKYIQERLEASGIRSLNNLIDVTNYVMRKIGHPTHVFDFDRLNTDKLIIRESKKGEKIVTLDKKEHLLPGGDIIADNTKGEIVDLLAVMGTENSVVTDKTKRILFFINNNNPSRIRKTSMALGIRTEAAIVNEKGVDPKLAMDALLYGIKLFEEIAKGKVTSKILDFYPNKQKVKKVEITKDKLDKIIGVNIPLKKVEQILLNLAFKVEVSKNGFSVTVPSFRANDIEIEEDIIEEVARIFGYHKIPNLLPPLNEIEIVNRENNIFYWEDRVKQALKYWGFTEVYSYSFVSSDLFEGPIEEAVALTNPLSEDSSLLRRTLVPSLLNIIKDNKGTEEISIFEISNIYEKREKDLPKETLILAGAVKKQQVNFFEIKGIIEQLLTDMGIKNIVFKPSQRGGLGASVSINKDYIGEIEMLRSDLLNFELNFEKIVTHSSLKKVFQPFNKFPPVFEDLAVITDLSVLTSDLISNIQGQSDLISDIYLLDQYNETRTFHITYQSAEKNLTSQDIKEIREKIISSLQKNFNASFKN